MIKIQKYQLEALAAPIVFLLLFIFNCIFTPNFANLNVVWNLFMQSAAVILIGLGMTTIISGGGIDISIGSIMAVCAMVFAGVLNSTGSLLFSFLVALGIAVICGVINGLVISRFKIQPMIATMAMMYILRSVAKVISNGGTVPFSHALLNQIGYERIAGVIPYHILIIFVAFLMFYLLLNKSCFGVYVEACGDNPNAAKSYGLRVVLYTTLTYVIGAIMAAFSGILESLMVSSVDPISLGNAYEMDAIAATVVGGTPISGGKANVIGTIFGALILQLITIMINMNNIQYEYTYIVKSCIIIIAVLAHNLKRAKR